MHRRRKPGSVLRRPNTEKCCGSTVAVARPVLREAATSAVMQASHFCLRQTGRVLPRVELLHRRRLLRGSCDSDGECCLEERAFACGVTAATTRREVLRRRLHLGVTSAAPSSTNAASVRPATRAPASMNVPCETCYAGACVSDCLECEICDGDVCRRVCPVDEICCISGPPNDQTIDCAGLLRRRGLHR